MEILNPATFSQGLGLKTLEQALTRTRSATSLRIGLPKERSNEERRICLTPGGVSVLIANGHQVVVEKGAGEAAHFPDREYSEVGAEIALSPEELYKKSALILKIAPPVPDEVELMQPNQVIFSALHLGNLNAGFLQSLLRKNITGIGFEFIQTSDGSFPIVRMLHEITGSLAVQIAVHYLETSTGGQGILLGGISGVPPATVLILGAGIIGEYAARTAIGYGAQVFVLDNDLSALRRIESALNRRVHTAMANVQYLASALPFADVVIGAAMEEGNRAPVLITEAMVESMKPGSVIVDAVIDQGGCIATSRPTTHSKPVFRAFDVIHYCVPNIPSNVARTSTYALNNVMVPFLVSIGDAGGLNEALWSNTALRNGTYIYKQHLTKKTLSHFYNLPYRDIEMLIASRI
jgi:alanine dehydrogenase